MESQEFQHIATAVRPKLMSLCRSFLDRQQLAYDAEDAVQETLLRLWQMRDRLGGYQKPEALAMLIAKNVCIDILKLSREQHEPLGETANFVGGAQADQSVVTHDTERLINHALAKLPPTERRMLLMRSEGMSMAEIAAACGATSASVKSMVCAARKRLTILLKTTALMAVLVACFFLLTNKQPAEAPSQPRADAPHRSAGVPPATGADEPSALPRRNAPHRSAGVPPATDADEPSALPRRAKRTKRPEAATTTEQQMNSLMSAVNFANEQVEAYCLQPVGDAIIVTKTLADGTSASYLVCPTDDNEGLHVVPIHIEM